MPRALIPAIAIAALLAVCAVARADEKVLSAETAAAADKYEKLATDGHYIQFTSPAGWPHAFTQGLSFYGYRFGEVGNIQGSLVIWSMKPNPDADKPVKHDDPIPPAHLAVIYLRKQFALSTVPEKPGWFTLALDPVDLPRNFAVTLFTSSTDAAGAWVGLSPSTRLQSVSTSGTPSLLAAGKKISFRRDGRNWMVRLNVRDSLKTQTACTSAQLCGAKFASHDDGVAEGFATVQKDGPMVRFTTSGHERIARVYVYGKLAGDWFNSDRDAGVWLLDSELGIIFHAQLPYKVFTNEAGWAFVDLPDIELPQTFYVLVEPESRPQVQLLVGYDGSSPNAGSLFGTAGSQHIWAIDAPEESTNWMIRVGLR